MKSHIEQRPAANTSANTPDHFVATAAPRKTPDQTRYGEPKMRSILRQPAGRRVDVHPLAVEHQEQEAGDDERRQEDVEHGDPALHDMEAVQSQQQRREPRPPLGAPEPEREEVEESDPPDAEGRRREPPSDRP